MTDSIEVQRAALDLAVKASELRDAQTALAGLGDDYGPDKAHTAPPEHLSLAVILVKARLEARAAFLDAEHRLIALGMAGEAGVTYVPAVGELALAFVGEMKPCSFCGLSILTAIDNDEPVCADRAGCGLRQRRALLGVPAPPPSGFEGETRL